MLKQKFLLCISTFYILIYRYCAEGHGVILPCDVRDTLHASNGVRGVLGSVGEVGEVVKVDQQQEQ